MLCKLYNLPMQNRIRLLRAERKWSQAKLAEALGVSRQTVNALESGKYDPSLPLAFKIAQLFHTSIELIFSVEEGTMFAPEQPADFPNSEDSQLFARFTPTAIKVMQLAQKETRRLKHSFVGTEQLLLALIEEGHGIAAQALKLAGIQLKPTRTEIEKIIGRGDSSPSVEIPLTPRAKLAIVCAADSATELAHYYIDTENLLLGLLWANKRDRLDGQGEGVAISVLKQLGINLELLEQQVFQLAPRGNRSGILTQPQTDSASPEITRSDVPQNLIDFTSSEISARFCAQLFAWVEPRQLGRVVGSRTQFQLADGKVLIPRLAFVAADRMKRVPRTYPQIVPDLIVEIKSAFDSLSQLQEKMQEAIALGVRVGLLIDPDEHTVTIYRPDDEMTVLGDREILTVPELFPGWELPTSSLWSPVF
jgi:DNA-binding XRE family transcriptional regulator/Uma2 family endonuclease